MLKTQQKRPLKDPGKWLLCVRVFAYYHWNRELGGEEDAQKNKEKTRTISKSLRGIYIEEERKKRQIFFNLFIVAVLTAHISICNTFILLFGDCVMYYCLTVTIDHVEIKT